MNVVLLSTKDVATQLGQSIRTIERAALRGDLPYHVVGQTFVFIESEVHQAMESGKHVVRGPGRPKQISNLTAAEVTA
jgi:excisionase family DNA binding protein